jgi:hypothetical protein
LKEIGGLTEGDFLSKPSAEEAGKRLAIGTKVGKYPNKAIEFRGLSVDDFVTHREDFVKIFKRLKINHESTQEPSVISLQNFKDVLPEPDFIEAMKIWPNQYTLIENLPLIGKLSSSKGLMGRRIYIRIPSERKFMINYSRGSDRTISLCLINNIFMSNP